MLVSLAFVVAAYLIGSVSFAVVTSKLFGLPDPHSYGSGNPGATNVLRTGNKAAAVLTLVGDGAKGWLAVFGSRRRSDRRSASRSGRCRRSRSRCSSATCFRCSTGSPAARAWPPPPASSSRCTGRSALALAALWLVMAVGFKISSLAALTTAALMPIGAFYVFGNSPTAWAMVADRAAAVLAPQVQHPAAVRRAGNAAIGR